MMKHEVYCSLNINECIEVDAEDEDEARIEARMIFSENISMGNRHWKEVECEVVKTEE